MIHSAGEVLIAALTSSLNSADTCITDGGASSELDRDRETTVVSSLVSYLVLISHCGTDQLVSTMRTLSRL